MSAVIIDTNLLLLLSVGAGGESDINSHKRLAPKYGIEQFYLLLDLLEPYKKLIVTPHILTETDYFVRQINEPARSRAVQAFQQLINSTLVEINSAAKKVAIEDEFYWLGLADVGQILLATNDRTLLTADAPLYAAASTRGLSVVNFWHEWASREGV